MRQKMSVICALIDKNLRNKVRKHIYHQYSNQKFKYLHHDLGIITQTQNYYARLSFIYQ